MTYQFTKTPVDVARLTAEIRASAIVTALAGVSALDSSISIEFRTELSQSDLDILGDLIAEHTGEPFSELVPEKIEIETMPPFAEPAYRTKLDATSAGVEIAPGESGNIDYVVPSERWVYGGSGLVVNAEPGDWFEAKVVDVNGLIPEAYRTALCEASPGWPVVNTYVLKQWILAAGDGRPSVFKIDTYPLIAKVTGGLVLRTTYHATSTGSTRKVFANILQTVKL